MSYAYHDALPGYAPEQVLHDGCEECEERGRDLSSALAHMDAPTFRRAWLRAADLRASTPPSGRLVEAVSKAEAPLLDALWALQLRFEGLWPLGTLPEGTR